MFEVPHSSGMESFPRWGFCDSNQKPVAIAPSEVDSVRNLFRILVSGSDDGTTRSHGTRIKSFAIRLEKCLSRAQVPLVISCDSSYVCRSILNDEKDVEE